MSMRIYLLKREGKLSKQSEDQGKQKKISLYLMYHFPGQAKREYEFLNLYLYAKPRNQIEKDHNKSTLQLAETIRAKRIVDSQTSAHGFISKVKERICFVAFFKQLLEKKTSIGNYGNWKSTYEHLLKYTRGKQLPMHTIDERWLEGFKEYLSTCSIIKGKKQEQKLNPNSSSSYFNKVRAALRICYNQKMIKDNPATRVKSIKGVSTHREFLTVEELQKLATIPCKDPLLGKAFLFGSLTGLRFSDIRSLRWKDLRYSQQSGYSIQYTQQKTKKAEVLPVAEHVVKMLGEKGDGEKKIFEGISYSAHKNKILQLWVNNAGIYKKISFHCSRHSQAVMQISSGTDIHTVSHLLGHANIKTTMHYLHVINQHKIDAANKVPQLI